MSTPPNDPNQQYTQPDGSPYGVPASPGPYASDNPYATPGYQAPTSPAYPTSPGYPQQGYPQQGYPQQGYPQGYPQQGYGYAAPLPPSASTNTMAIMSIIFAFVFSPLGVVFGHMAKKQIRQTGEGGEGLAMAGLIIGYVFTAVYVALCAFWVIAVIFFASAAATVTSIPTS